MKKAVLLLLLSFFVVAEAEKRNYLLKPTVSVFINELVDFEDMNRTYLTNLFGSVSYQQTALSFYNKKIKPLASKKRPNKKRSKPLGTGSWDKYSHNLLKASRVKRGQAYLKKHKKVLNRAYKKYGVSPEYITAIIGIESYYGANTGKYPVFDTLATLAFETNRRQSFFRSELKAFLLLAKEQKINPKKVKGSYAGAIGLGQFMPTNYKPLAIDFNNDGKISLHNHSDAIGSIAHYLKKSGWKKNQEVAIPVSFFGKRYRAKKTGYKYKYKRVQLRELRTKRVTNYRGDIYLIKLDRSNHDEMWFGTKNFYAITRYNHNDYYAMSVHQLAQKLIGKNISYSNELYNKFIDNTIMPTSQLDSFLDSPTRGRKFIIDLK